MTGKNKIYLIDGYNFIYRLFYAIPPFTLKDGTPINATFGLAKMIVSWYKEDRPDYLVFILDHKGKNFREEIYPEYKGTRDKMPTDLKAQESLMFEVLDSMGIPMISMEGYEADDIIGTLATRLRINKENDIYILSGDKDLYQFIDGNVAIYDTMKRKVFHHKEAIEKFGVDPKYIVDYLSICGDSSDNIPGISGFGPKKAQELINTYGSLEDIYDNIDSITGKTRETLAASHEIAFLSKSLASINTDLELNGFNLDDHIFKTKEIFTDKAIDLFKRFEFKSLIPAIHQAEIKNFDTLGIKRYKISDAAGLRRFEEILFTRDMVSISTIGDGAFELESISFYLGEKEIYHAESAEVDLIDFIKRLLSSDIEIIGFDIKEDLKRLYGYIEGRGKRGSPNNEFQSSFF